MAETKRYELIVNGSSGSELIETEMAALLLTLFEVFKKKQASYGKGNISKFGERGVFIRMHDKMERLYNMVWYGKDNPLNDETVDDTYMDLADYALIALLVRSGAWDRI